MKLAQTNQTVTKGKCGRIVSLINIVDTSFSTSEAISQLRIDSF